MALRGLSLTGARLESASLQRGHLVITLHRAVANVTVRISRRALAESRALRSQARRQKLKSLKLTVIVKDARGHQTRVPFQIRNLHLGR